MNKLTMVFQKAVNDNIPLKYFPRLDDGKFILKIIYTDMRNGLEYSREKEFNLVEYEGKILKLVLKDTTAPFSLVTSELFDYYVRENNQSPNTTQPDVYVGRLVFENGDVILHCAHNIFENSIDCEKILMDGGKSSTGILNEISTLFNTKYKALTNKKGMIDEIDMYNSIAYLEVQVDILTRILLDVLGERQPDGGLIDILSVYDTASVLDVKSANKLRNELVNKTHIRCLQEKYYGNKDTTN